MFKACACGNCFVIAAKFKENIRNPAILCFLRISQRSQKLLHERTLTEPLFVFQTISFHLKRERQEEIGKQGHLIYVLRS